jgi:hypothetical protein
MGCGQYDISIKQGATWSQVFRYEAAPVVYKAITAMPSKTPVRFTVTAHGMPDGWRCAVSGIKGPTDLNYKGTAPKAENYYIGTVVDANTIEFNDVNAGEMADYVSGGVLQYNTPVDMTGFTARMQIRSSVTATGTPLAELTSGDGDIVIDNVGKTITVTISATETAGFSFSNAVYDIELVDGSMVISFLSGKVTLQKEVTR